MKSAYVGQKNNDPGHVFVYLSNPFNLPYDYVKVLYCET